MKLKVVSSIPKIYADWFWFVCDYYCQIRNISLSIKFEQTPAKKMLYD